MNKKKILSLILCCFMVLSVGLSTSFAEEGIKININGKVISTESSPVIRNGRVLVPISVITKELGYKTEWNNISKSVKIWSNDKEWVDFTLGEDFYRLHTDREMDYTNFENKKDKFNFVDTEIRSMDVKSEMINNRFYIPLAYAGENLNNNVLWDIKTRTVFITNNKNNTGIKQDSYKSHVEKILTDIKNFDDEEKEILSLLNENFSEGNKSIATSFYTKQEMIFNEHRISLNKFTDNELINYNTQMVLDEYNQYTNFMKNLNKDDALRVNEIIEYMKQQRLTIIKNIIEVIERDLKEIS